MLCAGDGSEDGGLLSVVLDALAGYEGGAAVRELYDDGGVDIPSGLKKKNTFLCMFFYSTYL